MKQSSLDEQEQITMEMESGAADNEEDLTDYYRQYEDMNNPSDKNNTDQMITNPDSNNESQNNEDLFYQNSLNATPRLPWTPKVREKDIEIFLDSSRSKFIGFTLQNDLHTLAGLPQPIKEGVEILNKVI